MARMTEQDFEWLRRMAEEKQVSVSAAIRVLIQDEARRSHSKSCSVILAIANCLSFSSGISPPFCNTIIAWIVLQVNSLAARTVYTHRDVVVNAA
jgi:hypothetical protein